MFDQLGELERTHSCGSLRSSDIGTDVILMGWVAKKRDFGVLTFIDLRDRDGLTQIVISEEDNPGTHAKAKNLRGEFVIAVKGRVNPRAEGTANSKLPTGEIEVVAREILILNEAKTLPFQLEALGSENLASEDTRLKFRYLDLRRPQLQHNLRMRAKAVRAIREYMDGLGFTEIETPILLKSTPEGARDFIVPSRIHEGRFFALPQSPQILKQICMIAGLDKYFQIARCFRDEDLRADRQPEFTQLDVEMSFAHPEAVYRLMEGMFTKVLGLIGVNLPNPFPRMTYEEAIRRFGSDKPDLRYGMELCELTELFKETEFTAFKTVVETGGQIKCIVVNGKADYSRRQLDELQEFVKRYGAGGLAWIKVGQELTSSLLKPLGEAKIVEIAKHSGAKEGDAILIVAGTTNVVAAALGSLRNEVAKQEGMIDRSLFKPLIVTEFPMFEYNADTGSFDAAHHPFTSPMDEDIETFRLAVNDPPQARLLGTVRAKAYDVVINGYECAGGSIRIHQKDIQELNFKALGLTPGVARERFGFFLDALEFGTPPHGGFAAGIERTCMILCGTENIRDVMAFPKTASAQDLMMDAPGSVDEVQLKELGIERKKKS
jgi:aspartyl-tRNA synthetase